MLYEKHAEFNTLCDWCYMRRIASLDSEAKMDKKAPKEPAKQGRSRKSSKKRVTILDVAEDAQVSFAAVSKVLRNAYGVSDSLRTKVTASIEKLGYTPNTAARGMRGRTFVLGSIFPDFRNPFFSDLASGIGSALERTQYQTCMGIVNLSSEQEIIQSMIDMQMDGLIIVGSTTDAETLSAIGQKIPIVTIGHHLPEVTTFDTVNNNDQKSSQIVVDHLADRGLTKIAMLSYGITNGTVLTERERGYRTQMESAGLADQIRIVHASQSLRDIQTTAKHLLESEDRPEAIFCWTDFVALEVISVAESMGLRVPNDIAIVGHDNTMYCDFRQNNLTSIDQGGEQIGLQAARLLVERVEGRHEAEHLVLQPRLVVRQSSAADRRHHAGQG